MLDSADFSGKRTKLLSKRQSCVSNVSQMSILQEIVVNLVTIVEEVIIWFYVMEKRLTA